MTLTNKEQLLAEKIQNVLTHLPELPRLIFRCFFVEGNSIKQIAKTTESDYKTARINVLAAEDRFFSMWQRLYNEPIPKELLNKWVQKKDGK